MSTEICVIAPYPSDANAKDGMIQRVAHIDGLMADLPRTYLDLSFTRYMQSQTRKEGLATIHCLNVVVHFFRILALLKVAAVVYVHSAHNALRLMFFGTPAKVIFDAHGIVPEEMVAEGRHGVARLMTLAERFALRRCDVLVCVTHAMLVHFRQKHGSKVSREEVLLPILPHFGDEVLTQNAITAERETDAVIYAGGMQSWQNVDKMIFAAARQPHLAYTFLTSDVDRFNAQLTGKQVPRFQCLSVSPARVKDFYLTHHYGFVLREANLVNAVACPTKLVEYLYWGVIPVIITPYIGDFDNTSLKGVTLQQFVSGDLPDTLSADVMRRHNQATVLSLIASAKDYQERLKHMLRGAF